MHAWLLIQPGSRSYGMRHFRATPLAPAAGTCLISAVRADTQGNRRSGRRRAGAGSDGGQEENPFPASAAGRTLPETSPVCQGCRRAGSCSGPAAVVSHHCDGDANHRPCSRRAAWPPSACTTRASTLPCGAHPRCAHHPGIASPEANPPKLPGGDFSREAKGPAGAPQPQVARRCPCPPCWTPCRLLIRT